MKQRDKFRELYRIHHGDREKVVVGYMGAEERGDVIRKSNSHGISRRAYAEALYRDASRRGWHL